MVFTVFITIIHTYYGYNASGGPAGVGLATARAVRATTVIDRGQRRADDDAVLGAARRAAGRRLMERIRHRGLEIVLGLALAAVMVLGVVVIWYSFRGDFSDKITVSAKLAQAGDALEQGDIVTYRNVIVGGVTDSSGSADGSAVAKLKIDPSDAAQIPANVTAVAVPASLFGNTKIELLPPQTARRADAAATAPWSRPTRSPAAESLQTALSNAYHLLTAIHPAQLDAALSALATALRRARARTSTGSSTAPTTTCASSRRTSRSSTTSSPAWRPSPTASPTTRPTCSQSLSNTLVVAKGILADKRAVAELLAIAPTALDNAQQLLNRHRRQRGDDRARPGRGHRRARPQPGRARRHPRRVPGVRRDVQQGAHRQVDPR